MRDLNFPLLSLLGSQILQTGTVNNDSFDSSSRAIPYSNQPKASLQLVRANTNEGFIRRAIRQPLVHFIVAGFALFVIYALLHPERFAADNSRRIELSATDVGTVELAFIARWQRAPTRAELRGLLASEVRNEIPLGLGFSDYLRYRCSWGTP